ncbi:MAG: hypothetical protein HY401_07955 [Elusimicrobia bacterium]|nr:hypothetical protein [Elusimicrobiota bacterium]
MRRVTFPFVAFVAFVAFLNGCASTPRLKVGKAVGGEVVEAEGSCPVVNGDARGAKECSLREAQKKALEKVIGVYISAKTRVDKAVTIEQNILANSQGYISKYDVLKEDREGDYYTTKIRALVLFQKVADDLKNFDVLREPSVGLPRIAVVVSDAVGQAGQNVKDEDMPTHTYAANAISGALINTGFKLVDPEAIMAAKAYEAVDQAESNSEALKNLGVKLEAEIIVYGEAKTSPIVMDNNLLGSLKSYRAAISAKAARVATGEVLTVVSYQASGLDSNEDAAIQKALENVGKLSGNDLANALRDSLARQSSVSLTAANVADFGVLEKLQKMLEGEPGVKDLFLRSYESQTAKLDIYLEGSGQTGVQEIGQRLTQKLSAKVVRAQGNTLEVTLP